jgi:hypothetical protein
MHLRCFLAPIAALLLTQNPAAGADLGTRIPMMEKAAATFYVPAHIRGSGDTELMVDTGSGYLTINEGTLEALKLKGAARYVKKLQAVLANGSEMVVPVYAIDAVNIGGNCWLHNVEAAVFPGSTRQILGLSALRKAAPFTFSVDPPSLVLSHCGAGAATYAAPMGPAVIVAD